MTSLSELQHIDAEHHMSLYRRCPVALARGSGSRVVDVDGREYIDMLAGIAVNNVGHCHPRVVQAIRSQAGTLIHCSNFFYTEPQARLTRKLTELAGMDRVFLCNSGTEAVEAAIKLVRKWAGEADRGPGIVTMKGSFHGRTLAALAATGQDKPKRGFDPIPVGFRSVEFNDIDAVAPELGDDVCAVMLEPVQGEGGIRVADPGFLRELRSVCDETSTLLVFDEIQCGLGRTGTLFAFQEAEVVPDLLTLAKALGGGVPVGALLASGPAAETLQPGDHGTTFGGNPLAAAAAHASLSVIVDEGLAERSRRVGGELLEELEHRLGGHPLVREIRGRGLMIGIELTDHGPEMIDRLRDEGIIANCTAGNVVRLVPPLNIPEDDLRTVVDALERLVEALHDE